MELIARWYKLVDGDMARLWSVGGATRHSVFTVSVRGTYRRRRWRRGNRSAAKPGQAGSGVQAALTVGEILQVSSGIG